MLNSPLWRSPALGGTETHRPYRARTDSRRWKEDVDTPLHPVSGQSKLPNGRLPKRQLPTFLGLWGAEMRAWAVRSDCGAAHIGIGTDPHREPSVEGHLSCLLTKLTI